MSAPPADSAGSDPPEPVSGAAQGLLPPTKSVLLRSAGLIAVATILSRVLGLARETTITSLFPAGYLTDAYFMAFTIPDMTRVLVLSGILSAIFIPLFAEVAAQKGLEQAKRMAGQFLSLTLLVGTLCVVLGILGAPWIIRLTTLIAPPVTDQDPRLIPLAIELTQLLFPMLLLTGLSGLFQSVLNSLHDYRTPAWAPLWFNAVFIAVMLLVANFVPALKTPQMMCFATVLGMLVQVAVQVPVLHRLGIRLGRPNFGDPHWLKFAVLIPAAFVASAALVTNSFVDRSFAFGMGDAVTTAQYLSLRLQQLPIGIIAVTLVTSLFPSIAQKYSLGQVHEAFADLYLALRLSALALLPATLYLVIFATPIVRLLFNHGEFAQNPEALPLTAAGVWGYATATFPLGAGLFITRFFFAIQDRRTPVILGLCAIALNYAADWYLAIILGWGLVGLALSSLLVTSFILGGGLLVLGRRFPIIRSWALRPETRQVLLLAMVYGLVVWALARGIEAGLPILQPANRTTPEWADLLYLSGALVGSVGILIGAGRWLKVVDIETLLQVIRRKPASEAPLGLEQP